jgi:hypothetical protein
MQDVAARLVQLHEDSLQELYASISSHKAALHTLVQQARQELCALAGVAVGEPPQQPAEVSGGGASPQSVCAAAGPV